LVPSSKETVPVVSPTLLVKFVVFIDIQNLLPKRPTPSVLKVDLFLEATLTSRVLGGVGFERGSSGAPKGSLLVVPFFLNRHAHSMTQRGAKGEGAKTRAPRVPVHLQVVSPDVCQYGDFHRQCPEAEGNTGSALAGSAVPETLRGQADAGARGAGATEGFRVDADYVVRQLGQNLGDYQKDDDQLVTRDSRAVTRPAI
jgi:hypothetical protein